MVSSKIRKRQLEEKLGLTNDGLITSNFNPDITGIVWDILHEKFNLFTHPRLKDEQESDYVFFLIVRNIHASIWAIRDDYLNNISTLVSREYVSACSLEEFLNEELQSVIRRYHVIYEEMANRYMVQADQIQTSQVDYDICLYIGTLTLPEKSLDVIMAMIADKSYMLLQSDCLEYCKTFVYTYFDLIEEQMDENQTAILEKLTVTTNIVSQISERSGRQKPSSGFSIRSLFHSTFLHGFLGVLFGNFAWWLITRYINFK
ncbi:hypothetical protein LOTGIDRAFT_163461 [Lottia gigantea]|uniref:Uncharacterized protein n=1 Tax=Lottia gigantea TaxID=225164 RepID=V3ZI60_LOTGI|nr:hypothetical protein LOTGIDRAFT_163461 [Lottia gigantea]ESO90953.1 hypothetical protein LOTGIDRAFT_163461 [Lottia gigantea]